MRRFDKTKNIFKANLLAEQRYLESKGLIKESNYTDEDLKEFKQEWKETFKIMDDKDVEVDLPKKLMELKNYGVKIIPKIIQQKNFKENEWWENRFHKTTLFDFVDKESGDVYTFITNDLDWHEGDPKLYPYSKHELSFLYEKNLIDNAPKNAMDVIKFKNASPDLSNANLHSINERLH